MLASVAGVLGEQPGQEIVLAAVKQNGKAPSTKRHSFAQNSQRHVPLWQVLVFAPEDLRKDREAAITWDICFWAV